MVVICLVGAGVGDQRWVDTDVGTANLTSMVSG